MSIEEDEDIPYHDTPIAAGYVMRRQWMSGCAVFKGEQRITDWWITDEDAAHLLAVAHEKCEKLTNPPTGS